MADTIYGNYSGVGRVLRSEALNARPGQDLKLGLLRRGVLAFDGTDLNTQRPLPFKIGVYTGPGTTGSSGFQTYQNWLGCQEMIASDNFARAQWSDIEAPNFLWDAWSPICRDNPTMWLQLTVPLLPNTLNPATAQNWTDGANGVHDAHWNTLGDYIVARANLGIKRIIVRLHHEFNLAPIPGGSEDEWRTYWTRVVGLLRAKFTTASGVQMLTCWNPSRGNQKDLDLYWPGVVRDANATTFGGVSAASLARMNRSFPFRRRFYCNEVDLIGLDTYDQSGSGYTNGVTPTEAQRAQAWWSYMDNEDEFPEANTNTGSHNYMQKLSEETGTPLCIPEWGCWGVGHGRAAGGDNPMFIERMYNWMTRAGVTYACYFDSTQPGQDAWHQLWPGADSTFVTEFPNARDRYLELFGG